MQKKQEIIDDARKQAVKMIAEADETIGEKIDAEAEKFRKEVEKRKQEFLEKSRKESLEFEKNARKNVQKAADFLVSKFKAAI